jgi:hypothetical protein
MKKEKRNLFPFSTGWFKGHDEEYYILLINNKFKTHIAESYWSVNDKLDMKTVEMLNERLKEERERFDVLLLTTPFNEDGLRRIGNLLNLNNIIKDSIFAYLPLLVVDTWEDVLEKDFWKKNGNKIVEYVEKLKSQIMAGEFEQTSEGVE